MQELRELIVKWKNTVENLLKKVDGDWKKKSCLVSPSANGKQKNIVQTELYTVFYHAMIDCVHSNGKIFGKKLG